VCWWNRCKIMRWVQNHLQRGCACRCDSHIYIYIYIYRFTMLIAASRHIHLQFTDEAGVFCTRLSGPVNRLQLFVYAPVYCTVQPLSQSAVTWHARMVLTVTAIISVKHIKRLISFMQTMCSLWGTNWIIKYNLHTFQEYYFIKFFYIILSSLMNEIFLS
jgi:hypothetical protein